jgi:hypothetical protein
VDIILWYLTRYAQKPRGGFPLKLDVRTAAEQNLREMAAKDPQFRSDLLKNPSGTLEKLFGGKLPGGVTVAVHEETPNQIHIVIPQTGTGAPASGAAAQPHAYCSHPGGGSWSSCGYELTCYGPTCNSA